MIPSEQEKSVDRKKWLRPEGGEPFWVPIKRGPFSALENRTNSIKAVSVLPDHR